MRRSLDIRHRLCYACSHLAHRGAHSGCDPVCGARRGACARSRKPCELLSKQTLSYKTPLDCSTKNQWLSCVLQNAAAVISTAAPVIGIPQNEGRRRRRAFTPATGPTSLTWQARAQVQPHKTRENNPSSARKLRARSWKLPAAALSKQQRYSTIPPARAPGFLAVTDGTIAVETVMERDHSFLVTEPMRSSSVSIQRWPQRCAHCRVPMAH